MNADKRAFDLAASIGGILLTWPLMLIIAAVVKAQDGGPALFRQERVGRGGRLFRMWKFRTMVSDAAALGPSLTAADDERITKLGAFLRRTKLDELPQLFNVLKGEMTMVGPRPEVPNFVAKYTDAQRRVLDLTPGITDRASIVFVDEAALLSGVPDTERFYVERVMPEKIRLNLEYAERATRWQDLLIIVDTLRQMLSQTPVVRPDATADYLSALSEP